MTNQWGKKKAGKKSKTEVRKLLRFMTSEKNQRGEKRAKG